VEGLQVDLRYLHKSVGSLHAGEADFRIQVSHETGTEGQYSRASDSFAVKEQF
jgi:hypothetical protein